MAWVKDKTYSMTGDQFNRERAIADGYQIVLPEEDEAQLDIDSPEDYQQFKELLEVLKPHLKVLEVRESDSKTPGHKHITIKVDRVLYPIERIMLQACLGSDRKREILSYARVLKGEPDVSCFFEKGQAPATILVQERKPNVEIHSWPYCSHWEHKEKVPCGSRVLYSEHENTYIAPCDKHRNCWHAPAWVDVTDKVMV